MATIIPAGGGGLIYRGDVNLSTTSTAATILWYTVPDECILFVTHFSLLRNSATNPSVVLRYGSASGPAFFSISNTSGSVQGTWGTYSGLDRAGSPTYLRPNDPIIFKSGDLIYLTQAGSGGTVTSSHQLRGYLLGNPAA